MIRAALELGQEVPQEILDAEPLWDVSVPYAEAYHTLSKGRGYVLGFGAGGPLPIPYSEISRYWQDRTMDRTDLQELDIFVRLVRAQDDFFIRQQLKTK